MSYPGASMPEPTATDLDRWLSAGIAVFHGSTNPADFPPLDDAIAQCHVLGGFAAAWAECPAGNDGWCAHPLDVALMLALAERGELLARLFADGPPPSVVH
jgi:hypothetical protein